MRHKIATRFVIDYKSADPFGWGLLRSLRLTNLNSSGPWSFWFVVLREVRLCQEAHGECSRREHQHECGRPDPLGIADTHMRCNSPHEVEDETSSRRHPKRIPRDAKQQA